MEYREIGKTGKRAGIIGLGCEHLHEKPYEQVKETIDAALDAGVNILDVFMPGWEVRANIAKALGSRRGEVMIQGHIGSTDVNQQFDISRDMPTVRRFFEAMLGLFDGYVDFGMMFFIDTEKDFNGVFQTDFADYVQTCKAQGKIGHIGFSSHNPEIAVRAIETGLPEMMMFSVNPAFDMLPAGEYALDHLGGDLGANLLHGLEPKRAELYRVCERRQIGITVMKTLGGGKLISPEYTPFAQPLTVPQCVHYALSRPAVASVLVGCKTGDEVREAVRYLTTSDAERDYAPVLGTLRNDFVGSCVYCGHCQPCPAEIDIAAVNKYLDIARLDPSHVPPSLRTHYRALAHGADACVACGRCEERCPFGVPVRARMRDAAALLGGVGA
jgi:predicted aldo/keto reductase-like oxidoreductase